MQLALGDFQKYLPSRCHPPLKQRFATAQQQKK
jgi:hypothetical protein